MSHFKTVLYIFNRILYTELRNKFLVLIFEDDIRNFLFIYQLLTLYKYLTLQNIFELNSDNFAYRRANTDILLNYYLTSLHE